MLTYWPAWTWICLISSFDLHISRDGRHGPLRFQHPREQKDLALDSFCLELFISLVRTSFSFVVNAIYVQFEKSDASAASRSYFPKLQS